MRDTRCKKEVVEEDLNYLIGRIDSNFKGINNFFEKYKEYTKEEMSKIETFHVINRTFNSIIESKLIEQIDNVESITSFFPFNLK